SKHFVLLPNSSVLADVLRANEAVLAEGESFKIPAVAARIIIDEMQMTKGPETLIWTFARELIRGSLSYVAVVGASGTPTKYGPGALATFLELVNPDPTELDCKSAASTDSRQTFFEIFDEACKMHKELSRPGPRPSDYSQRKADYASRLDGLLKP